MTKFWPVRNKQSFGGFWEEYLTAKRTNATGSPFLPLPSLPSVISGCEAAIFATNMRVKASKLRMME